MRNWYLYTPQQGIPQDPTDPSQYTLNVEGTKPPSNRVTGKIYAIRAHFDADKLPIIDGMMKQELAMAIYYGCNREHIILRHDL
ncbi:hypothetical protein KO02_16570 [Sphingobacterium sp. ML3W]|uniref:hypothetical protein n=1 Tax=Sphingobacterium sp. ML3W TaxID=1538644 RepID=UPI0004F7E679|nr:hypothetical protein [Sphingobacterium sp. ML3W]AIM38112.1 hypothetical protein KO02_16570 [Sphingobacterium sp. ML3W]